MSLIHAYENRFGFRPPAAYRNLSGDHSQIGWPLLPEFHWLDASEISAFRFLDHQWPDFVPFARNTNGDYWVWCPQATDRDRVPVGICPADCEEGEIYAPDFSGALFRLICDAVQFLSANSSLVGAARQLLTAGAEYSGAGWPAEWRNWLADLSRAPVEVWRTREGASSGLLPRPEYERVVSEWLDDGETGSVFRWMTAP